MKTRIIVAVAFCTALVSLAGETYSLNTDWRFVKASNTIPLSAAKASVENGGVKVEIYEVKSSIEIKDIYLYDVAYQY